MDNEGTRPMASFEECIGAKIKEVQRMNREYEKERQRQRQEIFDADAASTPVVEATEVDSLEVVKARVFNRQGIIYAEKNQDPVTIKWYYNGGKIKFDTELSEEDLVKVIDLMLTRG